MTLGADVKHVWQAEIDGTPYEVVVTQRQWTGKVRVLVNGSEAAGLRQFDRDRRTRFFVAGRELTLIAQPQGRRVHFDLVLDGRSLSTGTQPRPPADPESLWVSTLLFFASLAFSLGTLWFAGVSEIRLATEGVKTQGHVTGGRVSSGRSTSYYLEYVFVSQDGGVHRDEGRVHTATYRDAKRNDPIEIVYVPADPEIQRATSFDEIWAIAGLVIGFGVCAISTTPSIWRAHRRRRMSQALATRALNAPATVERIKREGSGLVKISYSYTDGMGGPRTGKSPALYPEEAAAYSVGGRATIAYDADDAGNSLWLGASDPRQVVWRDAT